MQNSNLPTDDYTVLKAAHAIYSRPLVCQGGVPMGHDNVERDAEGNPITVSTLKFKDVCTKPHSCCAHLMEEKEKVTMRKFLTLLQRRNISPAPPKLMDKAKDAHETLATLDEEIRLARTGATGQSDLKLENVPTPQLARANAAHLEQQWHALMASIGEPLRQWRLALIEELLKEYENEPCEATA